MTTRNAGYDDFLDALEAAAGFYLVCPAGHGSLPPRRTCPHCGEDDLSREPLPAEGTLRTFTVVHVSTPQLADDTPYVTGIAAFGPVHLTGFVRGIEPAAIEPGTAVTAGVEATETTGTRAVVFRPR